MTDNALHQLRSVEQLMDIGRRQVGDHASHLHTRVDPRERSLGRDGFGQRLGGIGFIEQGLPLQVAGLDVVAINDP